jgi:uncharacterized protein YbaP (TraB family)
MLYELHVKGTSKINYLFGTIHLGGQEVLTLVEKLKPYINKVNHFYGEMDVTQLVEGFDEVFKMPKGLTIKDLYSPSKFQKINTFSKKYFDLDLNTMVHIKPLFILSKLSENIANHEGQALDPLLFHYALSRNIPIGGLESASKQMEIAESIPIKLQSKMLSDALKNINKFTRNQVSQIKDYYKLDPRSLYKKSKKNLGSLRNLILYERNFEIANKINEIMVNEQDNSNFFCFGAAHLEGGKGVIAYLKRMGYKIKLDSNWANA